MNENQKLSLNPKIIMGHPGSGKSTLLMSQALAAAKSGEAAALFIIEETALDELKATNYPHLNIWDFSNFELLQNLALTLTTGQSFDSLTQRLQLSIQIEQLYRCYLLLLENFDEYTLDAKSKALLKGACKIVFSKANQTFYTLYQFLIDYETRKYYLEHTDEQILSLLTDYELNLIDSLDEQEYAPRDFGRYSSGPRKIKTGKTDLSVVEKLSKQFNFILGDFRIKTLLSNKPTSNYSLSDIIQPGNLTVFYLPMREYFQSSSEYLIASLTLNLYLIQEANNQPLTPLHLFYDETQRIPAIFKLLEKFTPDFRHLQICPTVTMMDCSLSDNSFLREMAKMSVECMSLSIPSHRFLNCLHLTHLEDEMFKLDLKRHTALYFNPYSKKEDLILKPVYKPTAIA